MKIIRSACMVGAAVAYSTDANVAQQSMNTWTAAAVNGLKNVLVSGLDWYFNENDLTLHVNGTTTVFNTENYFSPMLDFLIAGLQSDNGQAMEDWYLRTEPVDENRVRDGPGPNTVTHMGYDDVKNLLENFGDKIEAGTLQRTNELGMQILGGGAWPEFEGEDRTIVLGLSNKRHAFVRPILGNMLDNNEQEGSCDGSTCWNEEWLQRQADDFFRGRDRLSTDDFKPFVTKILHKIHLDMDLTDAEAQSFSDWMGKILILVPLSDEMLQDRLTEALLGVQDTLEKRLEYAANARVQVQRKFPEITDPDEIALLASSLLDSLAFAGGLSVPTVLQYVVANTHMAHSNKHDSLKGVTLDKDNMEWILWETIRKYAPVAGVPFWDLIPEGAEHHIPNVAQALMDPAKFDEPLQFKNRGGFEDIAMAWAAPARHNDDVSNPNSHDCPAKELSLRIMTTFLNSFIERGEWQAVDADGISVNVNTAGSWTLLKKGISHTTGCSYWPSCNDGYSWESTEWCSWYQRSWTCRV